jgi:hypothetical protein
VHARVEEGEQAEGAAVLRQRVEAEQLARRRDGERDRQEAQRPQPGADLGIADLVGAERAAPRVEQVELGEPVEREMDRGDKAEREDEDASDRVQQELRPRGQKFLRRSMPRYRLAT